MCDLVQGSSRHQDRVSKELDDGAALYTVFLQQTLPLLAAQVPARLPDWIVLRWYLHTLLFRDLQPQNMIPGQEPWPCSQLGLTCTEGDVIRTHSCSHLAFKHVSCVLLVLGCICISTGERVSHTFISAFSSVCF